MATYVPPVSFEALVHEYDYYIEATLQRFARGRIRPDDMPDLKQAVYLRLLEHQVLDRYDPSKGAFQTLLFFVVQSVAVNTFYRDQRRPLARSVGLTPPGTLATGRLDPDTLPEQQDWAAVRRMEARDTVRRLTRVARASKHSAQLIQLIGQFAQDRSVKEMTAVLGSPRTVQKRRARLQQILRQQLKAA